MNNELNGLDDDLFAPISEQERASLIGGGKTTQWSTTGSGGATGSPTGPDWQADVDVDRNKDQTSPN